MFLLINIDDGSIHYSSDNSIQNPDEYSFTVVNLPSESAESYPWPHINGPSSCSYIEGEIVSNPILSAEEYKYKRKKEYPSLEEQLDMIYWDNVNGTTTFVETLSAIKTKYPK